MRQEGDRGEREIRKQKKGARPKRLDGASRLEIPISFSPHPSSHPPAPQYNHSSPICPPMLPALNDHLQCARNWAKPSEGHPQHPV